MVSEPILTSVVGPIVTPTMGSLLNKTQMSSLTNFMQEISNPQCEGCVLNILHRLVISPKKYI